jgi:2-hydroxychromene-2-carboxylate isomerase
MSDVIEYYFSLISTWSYIGSTAFDRVLLRTNARAAPKPVNLLKVFEATGGLPAQQRPSQRQAYRLVEMQRWSRFRQIPINLNPEYWPVNSRLGDRMVIAGSIEGGNPIPFAHACMRAVWVEERNIADPETLKQIANEQGLDGGALIAVAETPAIEAAYQANTDAAISRQVFGAPTYVYRDELFWGQDQLDHLERALAGDSGPPIVGP